MSFKHLYLEGGPIGQHPQYSYSKGIVHSVQKGIISSLQQISIKLDSESIKKRNKELFMEFLGTV